MRYLVDFKNTASDSEISNYFSANNCTVIKEWNNFERAYLVDSETPPPATDLTDFIIEDVPMKIKPLDVINVNQYWGTHGNPDDEKISVVINEKKDWWKNYSFVNPVFDSETLTLSRLGKGIKVYLMDSGIDISHEDFIEADIQNLYTVSPGDFSDKKGHGTALASVIVGKTCGITNVTIKNVKIFEPGYSTLQSEILNALDSILEDHVNNTFAILNCSWGIEKNLWVEHKLKQLIDEGVWIVAAAGNNGSSIEDITPASMQEALTVGAYNQDLVPCDFSNYTGSSIISLTQGSTNHGELDGWAPGQNIWAANLQGGYGFVDGTSASAAILTAVIASNSYQWLMENGNRIDFMTDWQLNSLNPSAIAMLAFGRENLLDFSDEKYKNSRNVIATIYDRLQGVINYPPDEFVLNIREGEKRVLNFVFEPSVTSKIEFVDPLPENFKLLPCGNLYGEPSRNQVPEGSSFIKYESSFKRFNSLNEEEELVKLKIYVLKENFDPGQLPPDHEIQITFYFTCGPFPVFGSCGPLQTGTTSCQNACAGGGCCRSPFNFKPEPACICASDTRLKSNIKKIGDLNLGIGLYEYTIFGKKQKGVMAQELIKIKPEAVIRDVNGYYSVDYSQVDLSDVRMD